MRGVGEASHLKKWPDVRDAYGFPIKRKTILKGKDGELALIRDVDRQCAHVVAFRVFDYSRRILIRLTAIELGEYTCYWRVWARFGKPIWVLPWSESAQSEDMKVLTGKTDSHKCMTGMHLPWQDKDPG